MIVDAEFITNQIIESILHPYFIYDLSSQTLVAENSLSREHDYFEKVKSSIGLDWSIDRSDDNNRVVKGTPFSYGKMNIIVDVHFSCIGNCSEGTENQISVTVVDVTDIRKAEIEREHMQSKLNSILRYEDFLVDSASRINLPGQDLKLICGSISEGIVKNMDACCACVYAYDRKSSSISKLNGYTGKGLEEEFKTKNTVTNIEIDSLSDIFCRELSPCRFFENLNKEEIKERILLIPVKVEEKILGVIVIVSGTKRRLKADQYKVLLLIASMLSYAWDKEIICHERVKIADKKAEAIRITEATSRLASIGTLASGIAHEINQPLNALKVTSDSMLYWKSKHVDISKDDIFKNLKFISEQATRIDEIITHMRELSRNSGDTVLEKVDVNLTIRKAVSIIKQQLNKHDIELKLDLSCKEPVIKGLTTQLEQVMINLVNNAREALDEHSGSGKFINIGSDIVNGECLVRIDDNAGGIPEESLEEIFDPFYTTKLKTKQFGFGLSMTRNIVSGLNGKISAENNKAGGVSFLIQFFCV